MDGWDDRVDDTNICGVDMSPEDEPGHYICDITASSPWPHCPCGNHHDRSWDCEEVAEIMAIDAELYSYAR